MVAHYEPNRKALVRKPKSSQRRSKASKHQASQRRRRRARAARDRQRHTAKGLDERTLLRVTRNAFGKLLHHKQVLSLALVTLGVIFTARMTIHGIGAAMAKARGRGSMKHGIKQVDRFMSNKKLKHDVLRGGLVSMVVGNRTAIDVSLDWTDFDKDGQTTCCVSLVMKHGRAIPLVWMTVKKSTLKNRQTLYERTVVQELRQALRQNVHVTLLADRGFGNTELFDYLRDIPNLDFIIRFRQSFAVQAGEYLGKAADAVPRNGRVRVLDGAYLTGNKKGPYTVVLHKAAKMKEPWCLATSLQVDDGRAIVKMYGRRFECEEAFRDLKDWRFGLALKHTSIKNEDRRERLLVAFALAAYLLTLVGLVSERTGCDRQLRANTSKDRTHSLFRQGRDIVTGALPDNLERNCLRELRLAIATALKQGFCDAMS